MTTNGFLPSCWFGRAGLGRARGEQRERRLATTAQRSGADEARRRATNNARRSDRKGAELQARGQERRTPQRSVTRERKPQSWSDAAASVEASTWFGSEGDRAQRHARASEGERAGTASAGPCGPGRGDRRGGKGSRAAGRATRAGSPTRRAAPSAATAAFGRRLRRARHPAGRSGVPTGLITAGTTGRNEAQRSGGLTCRRGSYRSAASARHSCRAGRRRWGAIHRTERQRRRKQGS